MDCTLGGVDLSLCYVWVLIARIRCCDHQFFFKRPPLFITIVFIWIRVFNRRGAASAVMDHLSGYTIVFAGTIDVADCKLVGMK
jgi:hypothetical protein